MTQQTLTRPGLAALVAAVGRVLDPDLDDTAVPSVVVAAVRAHLPGPDLLTHQERSGAAVRPANVLLHAAPAFSVQAVVWRPGQESTIHDHIAWCVLGMLAGATAETRYRDHGDHLGVAGHSVNAVGDVHGFAPPDDIHKVANLGAGTAISLHVYGADLSGGRSSTLRRYSLPIVAGENEAVAGRDDAGESGRWGDRPWVASGG